jgi:hypothetical protein
MIAAGNTARRASGALGPAKPALALGRDKGTSFTFHGHRLSSLYRPGITPRNPFIFPKILKKLRVSQAGAFEYLEKDERQPARLATGDGKGGQG